MKTYTRIFFILTIVSLIGGLFGKTPLGEPATHQLYVSAFCAVLTLGFGIDRLNFKWLKQENHGIKRDDV